MRFNPEFETTQALTNELIVVDAVCRKKSRIFKKLPSTYSVDFAVFNSENILTALAEVKCRNFTFGKYDTVNISVLKVHKCKALADSLDVPFVALFGLRDGVYAYHWTDNRKIEIEHGGRTRKTRGNADADIELMFCIPNEYLVKVSDYTDHRPQWG